MGRRLQQGFLTARAAAVVGLAIVVLASFGPWLRSGERTRSSYELVQVVDRLDVLDNAIVRWLPSAWICVPLLAAVAFACFVWGTARWAAVLTAVVGVVAVVVGGAVQAAPLRAAWGSLVGALGGAIALISATAVIATQLSMRGTRDE